MSAGDPERNNYLVLPLCKGGDLENALSSYGWIERVTFLLDALQGLQALHEGWRPPSSAELYGMLKSQFQLSEAQAGPLVARLMTQASCQDEYVQLLETAPEMQLRIPSSQHDKLMLLVQGKQFLQ